MAVRVIKKSLAGSEDLLLGFGTEVQVRNDKNIEITRVNAGNIPYDENKSISEFVNDTTKDISEFVNDSITKKVDTLAALRSMTETFDTIWVSGYYAKNDGAFGSHIFRLKGVKTTETDNGGTIIISNIGGVDYVYELQFDGAVNVKWFGANGAYINDSIALQAALNTEKNVSFYETIYINTTITIPSNIILNGNNNSIVFDNLLESYSSDYIFNGNSLSNTSIININFQGSTTVTPTNTTSTALNVLLSMSDSFRCEIINCSFIDVIGQVFRLNRSISLSMDNVKVKRVEGAVSSPGSVIYALGITKSTFSNIECDLVGDHLFYLQGTTVDSVDSIHISNITARNTGENGLTGGASLVLYDRCNNIAVNNYTSTSCRSGIFINTKNGFDGEPSSDILITNFISRGDLNRGLLIMQNDTSPTSNFKRIHISNISICNTDLAIESKNVDILSIKGVSIEDCNYGIRVNDSTNISLEGVCYNSSQYGIEITNVISGSINMTAIESNVTNLAVTTSSDLLISGNYSLAKTSRGITLTDCTNTNINSVIVSRCYREGILISGSSEYVYINNPILLPTNHPTAGGVNDTFRDVSTSTTNVFNGTISRDMGNVIGSTVWGSFAPVEGIWNRGDRVLTNGATAGGIEGWVCTVSGTPGTWKEFGTISA